MNIYLNSHASLKSKGMYSIIQILIKRDDFSKELVRLHCKEGKTSFESTWRELKDMGYLEINRLKESPAKYEYKLN